MVATWESGEPGHIDGQRTSPLETHKLHSQFAISEANSEYWNHVKQIGPENLELKESEPKSEKAMEVVMEPQLSQTVAGEPLWGKL